MSDLLTNLPPAHPLVRFALLSDTHVLGGDSQAARTYRAHLQAAIAQINAAQPDMVLTAGDCTENGTPDEVAAFQEQIRGLRAPVRVVPGNHDIGAKHLPSEPEKGVTQARVEQWENTFGKSWTEDINGVRLIGINTSVLGSGLICEPAHWEFLRRELERAAAQGRATVLVQHYPLFLEQPSEPGGDYWNIEPAPRKRFLDLLDRCPPVAVLSGHIHHGLDIRYGRYGATRLITTPPVSFGLPFGEQPEGWTLITVCPQTGEVTAEFHPVSPFLETEPYLRYRVSGGVTTGAISRHSPPFSFGWASR